MLKCVGVKVNNSNNISNYEGIDGLKIGSKVVVETENGHELAVCVELDKTIDERAFSEPIKQVVRVATSKDIDKMASLEKSKGHIIETATKLIQKYKLDMKVVGVSFVLDTNKTTIYFVCEDRVDFRELVKELAGTLKSRIELRQIGTRDHAKLIGGLGACGKECCCSQFLNNFDKVSVKMAKIQGLSPNPAKISGTCGRLMCCLAYENDYYVTQSQKFPKINSFVSTPKGKGVVVYNDLLREKVSVRREVGDGVVVETFEPSQVKVINKDNNGKN